jgi:hypothetical protein
MAKNACHSERSEESPQPQPKSKVVRAENRLSRLYFEGFFTPLRSVQNDMALSQKVVGNDKSFGRGLG